MKVVLQPAPNPRGQAESETVDHGPSAGGVSGGRPTTRTSCDRYTDFKGYSVSRPRCRQTRYCSQTLVKHEIVVTKKMTKHMSVGRKTFFDGRRR